MGFACNSTAFYSMSCVGWVFFVLFNLSLATESLISAAAQQVTTALVVGKKILAHNFSSKVHFGHVP